MVTSREAAPRPGRGSGSAVEAAGCEEEVRHGERDVFPGAKALLF